MPNKGVIIFLLIVGIQVVAGILSQVKKGQKQKQKQAQAAQRGQPKPAPTRTARGQRPTMGAGGVQTPTTGTGSGTGQSRLENLAARRKSQLEELRRRRAAASPARPGSARPAGGSPSAPGRPVQPVQPVPATRPLVKRPAAPGGMPSAPISRRSGAARAKKDIASVGADFKAVQASEEGARRQRDEFLQKKLAAEAEYHRRDEELKRRRARERRQQQEVHPVPVILPVRAAAGSANRRRVMRMLRRGRVRDAILLREILDGPVSMRS